MSVLPWSYSSLTAFETCPRRYYLTRVAKKVKEPPTEATIWGNKVHNALEDRVKLKKPLPEGMDQWERLASKFDRPKGRVFTETRYTFTRNLKPCDWGDKQAWMRGIIDLGVDGGEKAVLFDWKTGKVRAESDQLKLFAAFHLLDKPYAQTVRTGFIWLNHNKMTRKTFTREDLPGILEEFMTRSQRLESAVEKDRWIPRPSGLCRAWCPVGMELCEFCGK